MVQPQGSASDRACRSGFNRAVLALPGFNKGSTNYGGLEDFYHGQEALPASCGWL
jgi:hypothetical protein